jgi:hypothetical protein
LRNSGLRVDFKETEGLLCKTPEITDFRIYFSTENFMDRVHEFLDRAGVADGRGASELSLAAAPGHGSLPRGWQRERARRGATGGPLTGARVTARRRRTGDEASTPSSHGAGTIEEGRRRGEVVWCSTGVRVPFYRVRRGRAAGNGGRRR